MVYKNYYSKVILILIALFSVDSNSKRQLYIGHKKKAYSQLYNCFNYEFIHSVILAEQISTHKLKKQIAVHTIP